MYRCRVFDINCPQILLIFQKDLQPLEPQGKYRVSDIELLTCHFHQILLNQGGFKSCYVGRTAKIICFPDFCITEAVVTAVYYTSQEIHLIRNQRFCLLHKQLLLTIQQAFYSCEKMFLFYAVTFINE